MNSVGFPKMFTGNSTKIISDTDDSYESTLQSLHLFLSSEAGTLFGDPDFGIKCRRFYFNQNNYILKDILIDEIYSKISTFFPQIYIERKYIKIEQSIGKLHAKITCTNRKNYKTEDFDLVLFNNEEIQ